MTKQTHIEGPFLSAIYHDYYKDRPKGEATFEDKQDVLNGKEPLNAGSRCIIDLNAMPEKKDGGEQTHFWPTYHFTFSKDGSVVKKGEINKENHAIDGYVALQAPESEGSVFQRSFGYRGIFEFDPSIGKCAVEITADCQDFKAGTLTIPWVAHA